MAGLNILAGLLLTVAFIGHVAHGRVTKVIRETVYEVKKYPLKALNPKLTNNFGSPMTCNYIYDYMLCATTSPITGGYNVDITAYLDPLLSINVTSTTPAPVCIGTEEFGRICASVSKIDLTNMKGCVKLTAPGKEADIGCFGCVL